MFTGIVEAAGVIEALERGADGGRIRVRAPEVCAKLKISDSVAVNGCCLTVVELADGCFAADLSGETLRKTSFGELEAGRRVNLERPLAAGAPLGGHFVQGHVDGVGRVAHLRQEGESWWYGVRIPGELAKYVAPKGSIAIDGISLTVAMWTDGIAEAAIIPHTYTETNLRERVVHDAVNIEVDILAKYVERMLDGKREASNSRLTLEKLMEEGF